MADPTRLEHVAQRLGELRDEQHNLEREEAHVRSAKARVHMRERDLLRTVNMPPDGSVKQAVAEAERLIVEWYLSAARSGRTPST